MGAPEIPFNPDTARKVKETFNKAAGKLKDQVGGRNGAADTILKDFKGPYATVYATNKDTVSGDSNELAGAMEQVAYIMDRAIEAYEEAKADAEKSDWENFKEDVKEFFGAGEQEEVPPAPALPSASTPSTSSKETPTGQAGQESVVSGVPSNMREGTQTLKGFDDELTTFPGDMKSALEAYASECTWAPITVGNIPDQLDKWLKDNSKEQEWLNKIADEFERISGNAQQVSTVPTSAMEAAVGNANSHLRADLKVDTPTIQGSEAAAGYIGDPVNAATGNFIEPETDLAFTGASSALSITRMYNALNRTSGVFGLGWSSSLDMRLILTDENATWIKEDGQHLIFPRRGDGWERADAHALWLTKEAPESLPATFSNAVEYLLVVRDNQGSWWAFDATGKWIGHGESTGNIITVERGEHQEVTRIQHARGRFIDIEYADSKVAYVQSNDGTRVEYIYDEVGKLTGARTAAGTRHYDYNEQDLISAVIAADGTVEVENFYDALGRVRSQRYPHGVVRKYSYLSGGVTLVTNEDGSHANSWISDAKGRLVGMIDANQNRQSMGYDTFNNRVSVTERDGSTTVRLFNKRGLLTREVTPEGADITCEWDEHDRLITMVTASGAVMSYEYADSTGEQRNPSVLIDALGGRTEMVWRDGLLMSMLGPTGVGVAFTYDTWGDLLAITNAVGDTTRFERDSAGRITSISTPLGARTLFTYDAAGNLVSREDADGAQWRFTYGVGGRLNEVKDPAGAVTKYEYGPAGEAVAVIDPLGRRTVRTFDSMGNVDSLTSPSGATWAFVYDELMQNVGVVDPLGNTWGREFDVNGEVTALIDPTGVRTTTRMNRTSGIRTITDAFGSYTTHFDAYGRPVKESSPDGSEEVFTYDAAGNVVEILDAEGQLTMIGRDARGEITSITSPEGRVTSFTYDECGRPWKMTDPAGVTITLTYDADSRVVGRVSSSGAFEELTYDAVSRVLVQRTNIGIARYGYDACGRVTSAFDTKFGRRRFVYDAAGQLVKAVNGLGGVTRFEYIVDGLLSARIDPNGSVTHFTYDDAGQLVSTVNPLGQETQASYDAAGRLTTTVNPDGDKLSYTYDAAGLLEKSFFNQQLIARVERDVLERTVRVCDHTAFGTDLIAEGATPTVHTFTYDRLGRAAHYTRTVASSLNAEQHVSSQGQGNPDTTYSYEYTPDGAIASTTVDGVCTDYVYAPETGLLTSAMRSASSTSHVSESNNRANGTDSILVEELAYHYDASTAALIKITDSTGAVVRSFDTVPTVVPATDTAESGETSYRADGGWATISTNTHPVTGEMVEFRTYYNHLGLVIGAEDEVDGLRLYTYDDAHQLTSVRSEAGTHTFTYSSAGFLTEETTPEGATRTYTYNPAGQLTHIHDTSGDTYDYIYDGLGRRLRVTTSQGDVTEYAYGAGASLPGTITTAPPTTRTQDTETDGASAVSLWVDALGQVAGIRSGSAGSATSGSDATDQCFLSWDVAAAVPSIARIGQVPVSLATGVSTVPTGVRGVDPFALSPVADLQGAGSGVVLAGVGVTAAGSLALGGLEVLGARVYDPVARGFMSVDPLASPVGAGWGANVYAFVGNDPVGLVDPWGLSPMTASEFREYRADTRGRAGERIVSGVRRWADEHAGAIATAAIIAGTVVSVAALVATGPVGLIVAGAVGGGLLSGGLSILTNRGEDGRVDWGKVGLDTLIGGVAGGLGGAAVSVVGKAGAAVNAFRSGRFAVKAEAAGAKALALGQKAANSSVFNPMRYVNAARSSHAEVKAAAWAARSDELGQVAAHFGDVGGYARSLSGQTVNGVVSNMTSNNLAYGLGDFEERTAGGFVRATVSGVGVGVVSPRVTPLRQQAIGGASVDAGVVEQGLRSVGGFAADRFADFGLGMGNYAVTPQEEALNWEDAFKDGFKSAVSGGSGMVSSGSADSIRVATPRQVGE